ncbi:hypothetical protein [Streptomyces sp. NPDC002851]
MRARRTPNARLRARLEEAQWNGAELARSMNAAAGQAGIPISCDRSNVSHWLAGTRPRPAARELLVRVFSKRLGRAVTSAELGFDEGEVTGAAVGAAGAGGSAVGAGGASGGFGAASAVALSAAGARSGSAYMGGAASSSYGFGGAYEAYETCEGSGEAYGRGFVGEAYGGTGAAYCGEQMYGHGQAYGVAGAGRQEHPPHAARPTRPPFRGREPETTRGAAGADGGEAAAAVPDGGQPVDMARTVGVRTRGLRSAGRSGALRELAELVQEHRDPRRLGRLRGLSYRGSEGAAWRAGRVVGSPYSIGSGRADGGRVVPVPRPGGVAASAGTVLEAALAVFERQGGRAARELIVAELSGAARGKAARLCRMLGRAWADELAHGAAQRVLALSRSLAVEAGDPVTEAMALRDMSVLALEVGRARDALGLAEAAVGTGWDLAGAGTRAFLLSQRAVALAVTGDGAGAAKDMDGAEYWIDGGEDDEHGPYPFGGLLYQRARMHRAEGDRRRSVSALELSLSLRPPAEQRSRALIRIELAHQHLAAGEYAAAAEEMRVLTPNHESLRSARVDAALGHLRGRALAPEPTGPLSRVAYRGRC